MKIAYFDCFAGAAGDMIVAAMLDAGLDAQFLKKQLATLHIDDLDIKITETKRAGLRALKFEPTAKSQHHHRNLEDITKIINQSKITENAKQTAISIFQKLAHAEAAVHNKPIDKIHFHEVGACPAGSRLAVSHGLLVENHTAGRVDQYVYLVVGNRRVLQHQQRAVLALGT